MLAIDYSTFLRMCWTPRFREWQMVVMMGYSRTLCFVRVNVCVNDTCLHISLIFRCITHSTDYEWNTETNSRLCWWLCWESINENLTFDVSFQTWRRYDFTTNNVFGVVGVMVRVLGKLKHFLTRPVFILYIETRHNNRTFEVETTHHLKKRKLHGRLSEGI